MNLKNCCENKTKTILMFSPVKFDNLWQRHQSFAVELAKNGFKVYYIDPILSNGFSLTNYEKKADNFPINIIKIKVPFKASSIPSLQTISVKMALTLVKKMLDINFESSILWISEPSYASITKYNFKRMLYDRCDLHGAFPGQNNKIWYKYERQLFNNSDYILVSHNFLKNDIDITLRNKVYLVKNAVSDSFFCHINSYINKIDNGFINIVSSGAHYEWIDFKWLEALANRNDVKLHIVGTGRGKEFHNLLNNRNVIYHGKLAHSELIKFLSSCHVGVVPFKDIDLIKGVDPVKVYEYAAVGLEIWAPNIGCLKDSEYITGFIDVNKPYEVIKNKNRLNTHIPTWKDRIKPVLKIIN